MTTEMLPYFSFRKVMRSARTTGLRAKVNEDDEVATAPSLFLSFSSSASRHHPLSRFPPLRFKSETMVSALLC
jgi:hypothetical protein